MENRIVDIGVGYDGEIAVFHLRTISVPEENRYTARFVEIKQNESDERKAQLEYDIFVDSLAGWSVRPPTKKVITDGEEREEPLYPEAETPAEAVRKFFENRNPQTERIAPAVIGRYRQQLQPDVIFY